MNNYSSIQVFDGKTGEIVHTSDASNLTDLEVSNLAKALGEMYSDYNIRATFSSKFVSEFKSPIETIAEELDKAQREINKPAKYWPKR